MNIGSLHTAIYHSLMEQIAVIDAQGQIVDVNRAWVEFGQNNGVDEQYDWINVNYLDALYKASQEGDTLAFEAYQGIKPSSKVNPTATIMSIHAIALTSNVGFSCALYP